MNKPEVYEMPGAMSFTKLLDLQVIQELPQLSEILHRRIAAETGCHMIPYEKETVEADRMAFLEETICELVDLLAVLETEVQERRRFKRL